MVSGEVCEEVWISEDDRVGLGGAQKRRPGGGGAWHGMACIEYRNIISSSTSKCTTRDGIRRKRFTNLAGFYARLIFTS